MPTLTLTLRPQENPLNHPRSSYRFQPSAEKPFVATPAAITTFGQEVIIQCLEHIQDLARKHSGIDYVQVFEDPETEQPLWFIEDGPGGAITALLPSDY
jgi:hypothetical protein